MPPTENSTKNENEKGGETKNVPDNGKEGERSKRSNNVQNTITKFHKEHSLREIDPESACYFNGDCMVK